MYTNINVSVYIIKLLIIPPLLYQPDVAVTCKIFMQFLFFMKFY